MNYTKAEIAPIIMCTIVYKGELLLVKRGFGLADAEGYWSIISGFIDEIKSVQEHVRQEIGEELHLEVAEQAIKVGKSYTLTNPEEKRSYIVFPSLVTLQSKPNIVLNDEHTDFKWIYRNELESFHILDDLPYIVDSALNL